VAGVIAWIYLLLLVALVTRRLRGLRHRLSQHEKAHRATRDVVDSLQLQNEMLQIIARAPDVTVAFQSLAPRITRLVLRSSRPRTAFGSLPQNFIKNHPGGIQVGARLPGRRSSSRSSEQPSGTSCDRASRC
jgi:hypothetical protein